MNLYFPNFKIEFGKPSRVDEKWRRVLFIFIFWRAYRKALSIPRLEYRITPLYSSFKKSWSQKFGKYFRFILVIIPTIILIRLILSFSNSISWWILAGVCAPGIAISIFNFIADIICKIRVRVHIASIETNKYVVLRHGRPGGGKTSSLLFDLKVLSDLMWEDIQREYKLLKPYLKDIPFWNTRQKEDALEIIESYEFYQNSNTYPCLWTSVPAFVDGVPTNRLTANHLMQRDRLPYGAVQMLDEVSLILPQELFRNKPIEISELCKFPRHFGDFHIGTTEQGKDNLFKDLRNSSSENKCMVKQKWILKPRFLIWFYNKSVDNKKKFTKTSATFFRILKQLINSIGYRRYTYYDTGTEDRVEISKEKTFTLPSFLNISYDSRAFKNVYRCKDKPLIKSSWEHLRLSQREINDIFTKELQERKTKAEVRAEENRKRRAEEKAQRESEKQAKKNKT